MSLPQILFLIGLSLILLTTVVFAIIVVLDATRSGSTAALSGGMLLRLWRSPAERAELDRWAFYVHRWSGFAIFAFLMMHIVDVGLFAVSPSLYDEVHQLYGSTPMRIFECGLLLAILFHAFNGLRVLAIDLGDIGPPRSQHLLIAVLGATIVLGIAGSIVIMAPVFA